MVSVINIVPLEVVLLLKDLIWQSFDACDIIYGDIIFTLQRE